MAKIKRPTETCQVPESPSSNTDDEVDAVLNKEIERKLKFRGQPIRLFGETDRQRMTRLKLLEVREEDRSGGQRNDFNELLEKQQENEEEEGEVEGNDHNRLLLNKRVKMEVKSIQEIEKIDRSVLIKDRSKARYLLEVFFNTLLQEWQFDLDSRPEDIKKSTAGRVASATFHQTREYLDPFFRMLGKDELPGDILSHVVDIVGFLQDREYVRANDTYLRLSIGNAPWPIGVTMVGIHERSAHEKINTGSVAHALNDEVTRKWIQSIKRLMTFCQKVYPPSDPSKAMG